MCGAGPSPAWPLCGQHRAGGGEERRTGEGPRPGSTEDTGHKGHGGAEKGQRRAGSAGEGRRGDSVIGAPPPSRPWAGDRRAGGSKLLSDLTRPGWEGAGPANPAGSPTCPSCPRAWISPKAGPDQPEIHHVQQDRGLGGLCRPCKEQALFPSRKKSHNLLRDPSQGYNLPTGLGVTMKPFLLVGRPPVTRADGAAGGWGKPTQCRTLHFQSGPQLGSRSGRVPEMCIPRVLSGEEPAPARDSHLSPGWGWWDQGPVCLLGPTEFR